MTAKSESKTLTRIGMVAAAVVVIAAVSYVVINPFPRKHDVISLTIETPYVGQGVVAGTPVTMHGVTIGEVKTVSSLTGGGVRMTADLQSGPARGLTDTLGIDYRPSNYFGVTGINVTPGKAGAPIRNGMQINVTPKGNFTLQALLYRFGELSNGVFDQRLISVIDRATRYFDGLNPLLETTLMVAQSVAAVQTVATAQLLRNATGISVAFPGFIEAATRSSDVLMNTAFAGGGDSPEKLAALKASWNYYPALGPMYQHQYEVNERLFANSSRLTDEYYNKHFISVLTTGQNELFTPVGILESSHVADLFPVIESVRAITDTLPKTLSAENFASTLTEVRSRFERMYADSGGQHALQVRIVLDRLPGLAGPLAAMGQQP
jgi:MlaD protein